METNRLIVAMLAAFGITAPVPEFLGGACLGLAGAYGAWAINPDSQRAGLWATLFVAGLICTVAAIAHEKLFPLFSLHLMMFTAGVLSRYTVLAMLAFGNACVERAKNIPGSIKFPWER